MSNRLLGKERVVVQDQGGVVSVPSPRLRASYSAATLLNAGSVWVLEDRHASSFERTLRQQSLIAMTRQPQLHLEAILLPHRLAEAGAATMNNSSSNTKNSSSPRCVLLSCPKPGEFEFSRRLLCFAHFEQLSRPSATLSLPPHLPPHCTLQMRLPSLQEGRGKPQPVRYRYTKKKKQVRLCQVGPCRREGSHPHGEMLVCKAHVVLLEAKERYIDQQKAAEYALDKSSYQIASRTKVCNYVDCNNGHVTHKYHGVFCAEHLPVIDDLRDRIMMVKCLGDEAVQIPLQYEEIFLRK
ncbi:hypothetical protein PC118_g6159 [Phytophthora cactorum]|uniref:Uncharacterized protein n=1 Tax=Phytophthora cactorum TaxID=29920 RepID=A0A8T0YHY3_9STRA|nr:hypothetical protein PC113_g18455 [Phytophthora cactorum]KAG2989483.1 hypothetical protein PC118_g6159 [Phytophthora cactorum]KAG3054531.1 hypothetical protein PC121_g16259 [Phytophthora cactorum]